MAATMTTKEAARIMGISAQTLRLGLQQGLYEWGKAVKTSTQYTYIINRKRFEEEWGKG